MLNFEEELKRFAPSTEVEEVEEEINAVRLADMTDIMKEMLRKREDGHGML